jgi:hypothetical protein
MAVSGVRGGKEYLTGLHYTGIYYLPKDTADHHRRTLRPVHISLRRSYLRPQPGSKNTASMSCPTRHLALHLRGLLLTDRPNITMRLTGVIKLPSIFGIFVSYC